MAGRKDGRRVSLVCEAPTTRIDRRPPMPMPRPPKGSCSWCEQPILYPPKHKNAGQQNMRCSWHPQCIKSYKIATRVKMRRRLVLKRDRGVCATCGVDCRESGWEADHRVPLWSVPRDIDFQDRMKYWGLDNLYTACLNCHKEKTKREAGERALMKREAKQRLKEMEKSEEEKS